MACGRSRAWSIRVDLTRIGRANSICERKLVRVTGDEGATDRRTGERRAVDERDRVCLGRRWVVGGRRWVVGFGNRWVDCLDGRRMVCGRTLYIREAFKVLSSPYLVISPTLYSSKEVKKSYRSCLQISPNVRRSARYCWTWRGAPGRSTATRRWLSSTDIQSWISVTACPTRAGGWERGQVRALASIQDIGLRFAMILSMGFRGMNRVVVECRGG